MSEQVAAGEVVRLPLPESELAQAKTKALVKTEHFESIRLCIPAGKTIPPHKAKGPITVQCLQGKVNFNVGEVENSLDPGDWLYLEAEQLHSLEGVEHSTLLLTLFFPRQ